MGVAVILFTSRAHLPWGFLGLLHDLPPRAAFVQLLVISRQARRKPAEKISKREISPWIMSDQVLPPLKEEESPEIRVPAPPNLPNSLYTLHLSRRGTSRFSALLAPIPQPHSAAFLIITISVIPPPPSHSPASASIASSSSE